MNRRQKKKAFKKKYGYNPPKERRIEISIDWNKVERTLSELKAIAERIRRGKADE